jgi:hypothetical protein
MTPEKYELAIRLENIFMPKARARRDALYNKKDRARFVHYTSAEAALNIIRTKRIWMRNTACMSDYREVSHGYDLLNAFFLDETNRNNFIGALDLCSPNIGQEAITLFNQWWSDIQRNSYISSISEHDDSEDMHGRLSMWRAYGGSSASVAIVFSVPWYSGASEALNVMFSPVIYLNKDEAYNEINEVISNVQAHHKFLSSVDRLVLLGQVFNMLVTSVTCFKHEGFGEELEWRLLYAPNRSPSPLVKYDTEIIRGIPQIVYKMPLDVTVSNSLADLDISRLFDRLIIGPSQFSVAQYDAFVDTLKNAGVPDAEKRVFISGIPIRT